MSDRPHRPRKRFGQHFLEPAWTAKVVAAIDPRPEDVFVEIGPGRGALTRALAARAGRLVAFEIDHDLAAELRQGAPPNVTIVDADFLDVRAEQFPACGGGAGRIRVAGNLPYSVASPILFKLLALQDAGASIGEATVMLQREVAARLLAVPGSKDYGVLTVLIRQRAEVTSVLNLPPGAFRPVPKVQSTVVRLRFHPADPAVRNQRVFNDLVKAVFTRRRKTLANALLAYRPAARGQTGARPGPGPGLAPSRLAEAGLDGRRRPETLTVAEFARLADLLADDAG
jgi:16S rRNA (adenine1518-N6/adenine1519-N6)-dimethyltransferase